MERVASLLLLALAAPAPGRAQVKVPLGTPAGEIPEPFTRITAIRELPNGRVLVADIQDKVVHLVDFSSGTATRVGREGRGPGEYALPSALVPLPDGSTLLHDMLNRRFLILGPDGKPGGFADLPPATATAPGGGLMIGTLNVQADARGRLYFQGSPFNFQTGTPLDSIAIVRWERGSPTLDTIAYYKPPAHSSAMNRSGPGGGNVEVRLGGQKVFTPTETWTATGDGRVARILPSPYRVVWYDGPGRSTAGPVQPYTPIKVGEAEKEREREARRRNRPLIITDGPGGASSGAPPRGQIPEPEFEETMPPFGAGGVLGTPDGEVWVLRNRPASERNPTYDVFDRTGALVKKVVLEPNHRVVGFGKGTVYVARSDEDDLQYLQRYRKP